MVYSWGAIILPILVFMCDAFADRIKSSLPQTKEQGEEWHFWEGLMLAFLFLFIAFLLGDWLYPVYVMAVRIWFFDPFLNILRKKPFFSKGTTSKIDKMFLGKPWLIIIVWAGAVIFSSFWIWKTN